MPGSVDHCWTTPIVCINGDFDPPCKGIHIPISDWCHRVHIEIWGPATCHACPAVSITFEDFTLYVKLAIQCAFIHPPVKCICDIDFLQNIFPVTIFYSLSLMLFIEWECLASSFNVQCLFYPTFLLLASPPTCVLSHCPCYYYTVAFQGICAQVFKMYSKRKLTDPHLQQKMWSISIHPCQYI